MKTRRFNRIIPLFRRIQPGLPWMALAGALLAGALLALSSPHRTGQAQAGERTMILGSTTSTENSGLLKYLLSRFKQDTGITVHVVAKGTGQAIRLGQAGDVDALLVHHRPSEDQFLAEGYATERRDVMYNDYVLVGPREDPAGIRGMTSALQALKQIAASGAAFTSRADDSGTHKTEMELWKKAGMDPKPHSGTWYREVGSGMGATLNTAAAMNAYLLSDRGTWLSFKNRRELEILVEGDPPLFNPYGILNVNPARHPGVKAAEARALMDWLVSPKAQKLIGEFRVNGATLFFPNPKKPG